MALSVTEIHSLGPPFLSSPSHTALCTQKHVAARCDTHTTVKALKSISACELGLGARDFDLILPREGRVLNDQMRLQHYGLRNAEGIQIQLRLRLRGGMGATASASESDPEREEMDFYSSDSDEEVPMHHEPCV